MQPLIIEAALNGATSKKRNPHVPTSPDEISADGLACLEAGAAIIHTHIEGFTLTGAAAAERYAAGWRDMLEKRPDAIVYGTVAGGADPETRFGHYRLLAERGVMHMGAFDPGSVNLCATGVDGLPGEPSFVYQTSYRDVDALAGILRQTGLGASVAVYEPGFLRATIAYHKAGRLPSGTFVKFYFGGPHSFVDGGLGGLTFGLPPTEKALAAYLEMLEGTGLHWAVAVPGGDVATTPLTRLAIREGGHVRVGLEDFAGARTPRNAELVSEIVDLARSMGRPVASPAEAARVLGLRHAAHPA
jgi:uncharacterized protein (DUF849 family)